MSPSISAARTVTTRSCPIESATRVSVISFVRAPLKSGIVWVM